MLARDIMTTPVTAVRPGAPIKEAAAVLAARGFTALPVVDADNRLVGIVTEADLVRDRLPRDPRARCHPGDAVATAATTTVGEVMTTPVTAMGAGTDVAVLAKALLAAGHRSMPIAEGSRLVGIVTRRDIVRVIAPGRPLDRPGRPAPPGGLRRRPPLASRRARRRGAPHRPVRR
jgi:CBS domain-containing protein